MRSLLTFLTPVWLLNSTLWSRRRSKSARFLRLLVGIGTLNDSMYVLGLVHGIMQIWYFCIQTSSSRDIWPFQWSVYNPYPRCKFILTKFDMIYVLVTNLGTTNVPSSYPIFPINHLSKLTLSSHVFWSLILFSLWDSNMSCNVLQFIDRESISVASKERDQGQYRY